MAPSPPELYYKIASQTIHLYSFYSVSIKRKLAKTNKKSTHIKWNTYVVCVCAYDWRARIISKANTRVQTHRKISQGEYEREWKVRRHRRKLLFVVFFLLDVLLDAGAGVLFFIFVEFFRLLIVPCHYHRIVYKTHHRQSPYHCFIIARAHAYIGSTFSRWMLMRRR